MKISSHLTTLAFLLTGLILFSPALRADSAAELDHEARKALHVLYAKNPKARLVGNEASAVLIFPHIVKAGFIFGGQRGDGVLIRNGVTEGYYNTSAASWGLQAGAQEFAYALFFMNRKSLNYLRQSDGWEIGVGPSIVIVDEGVAKSLSSTTLQKDIYAFFFRQRGLMAGLGLQVTKITQFDPSE